MENKIVFYSSHCPKCRVLEMKLKQKNIGYTEVDNIDEMIKLGITSAPQLSLNGEMMDFMTAVKWVNSQQAM
jgi:glutaredoxin